MDKRETKEDVENINDETAATSNDTEASGEKIAAAESNEGEAISKLTVELDAAKDKYIRLYSEFENFRRRTSKEKLELIQSANEQLIKSLLPVADDFERAENALTDKPSKEVEGFFLIHSKFKKVLDAYGAKAMEAKSGSDFDADLHEAISQVPAPSPELKGKIIDVVEKGYLLNDKVIRYAKVVVGN